MSLEEQLREAAARGLASLTIYAEWSTDHKTTYWTCRATPSARHGYVGVEHALDPVEAFSQCLKALPGAKVRESKAKAYHTTGREPAVDQAVTVAVTEPKEPTPGFDQWMKP
jgi:hypothetical protein